ncbi:hypothetical protein JO84_gp374 [Aureococcus anophagefferens virus]|uniref:Uncharacterized protein n=1 Tax=Aureococcus anophagefferens virus TaxID=1474867 RepID=A0A076FFQ2_9VIRU|nr:hypothetical protein JO84_gp374 [Aureococcus anophagefferens virus]AII17099.1 hypothetical protein AaV_098 [Aureococcus anophagefferens virus]UOG94397.1 hypothetical protein MKD35_362 [Aureococcus anophagefferens virus]
MKFLKILLSFILLSQNNAFLNFKKFHRNTSTSKIITKYNAYCHMILLEDSIFMKLSGQGDGYIVDQITEEFIKIFSKSSDKVKVLIDMKDAEGANRMAIQKSVIFARYYSNYFDKIAIIIDNKLLLRYLSIINFATYQKLHIKAFTNETDAKKWLKS